MLDTNYRVYGARKIWRELQRRGHQAARCTAERLMRELGIVGAVRGKRVGTTVQDPAAERAPDLVDRDFVAVAPNRCWMADFTCVAAWAGTIYVAFVVDTFSRHIVGWSAAPTKHTEHFQGCHRSGDGRVVGDQRRTDKAPGRLSEM
ncbi:IS3 family transposase, partial [Streptomyces sp. NPDC002659]|uniref:IS3 family transposase n=1 Tax=Streptomyces sp. NPDC002659 TaxID=3364656 RepID=UPI0036B1C603